LEAAEHVEVGHDPAVRAVPAERVTHLRRVEPAAAARTAGHGAVLVAGGANAFADLAFLLRRERAFTDARAIRVRDADHALDPAHREARARRNAVDSGVR